MSAASIVKSAEQRCDQAEHRIRFLEALLEQIGTHCDTLAAFARQAVNGECKALPLAVHMMQSMAERIGAVAELGGRSNNNVLLGVMLHLVGEQVSTLALVAKEDAS